MFLLLFLLALLFEPMSMYTEAMQSVHHSYRPIPTAYRKNDCSPRYAHTQGPGPLASPRPARLPHLRKG